MTSSTVYHEDQRFSPWLLGSCFAIAVVVAVIALVETKPAFSWTQALLLLIVVTWPYWLVRLMKLVTEVRPDGIHVRLFPLPTRHISPADIREAQVRTYRPILEYGGWGLRFGFYGMAYNARGNRGVQLVLQNGRRVLIGSQQPETLLQAIQTVAHGPA